MKGLALIRTERPEPSPNRSSDRGWISKLYRRKFVALTLALLLLGVLGACFELPSAFHSVGDRNHQVFVSSYYAFEILWDKHAPRLLYELQSQLEWRREQGFIGIDGLAESRMFPPQFAVTLAWFAAFPLRTAAAIWNGCAIAAYAASVWLLLRLAYRGSHWLPRLFMLAVALGMRPFYADLRESGASWLILLCLTLSFCLYDRNRKRCAGVPLAFAIVFQPASAVVLLYFLWRRQYVYALYTAVFAAAITVLTLPFAGYRAFIAYFVQLSAGIAHGRSILGALAPAGLATSSLTWLSIGYVIVPIILVACLPDLRKPTGNRFDFLVASLCAVWFSPEEGSDLLVLIVGYLMLIGIVVEKYAESPASLRFGVPERWGALCFFLALALTSAYAGAPLDADAPLRLALSTHLPLGAVLILSWKLRRTHTRVTVPLADYRRIARRR